MTVRITLTDDVLPPSIDFIDFVEQWISRRPFDGSGWAEHGRGVRGLGQGPSRQDVLQRVDMLAEHAEGRRYVSRAYDLFVALLIGDTAALHAIQKTFRFILIVGVPRSGGKYLTKQLFRALGHDPTAVPEVLGHDAYPDAGPWRFGESLGGAQRNGWTSSLQTMAEYLTMVEMFFGDATARDEPIVVPKKSTKAAYAAGLFRSALGDATEALVTVRHPAPACVSTYRTGGGFPSDGRFAIRGNIERFCARELHDLGFSRGEIASMDYFDAYAGDRHRVRVASSLVSSSR